MHRKIDGQTDMNEFNKEKERSERIYHVWTKISLKYVKL